MTADHQSCCSVLPHCCAAT